MLSDKVSDGATDFPYRNREMTVIKIKTGQNGEISEWAILELQGVLKSKESKKSLNEQFIGDLHYTSSGIPILIIGTHILYGKETKMEKPLAVLEKKLYGQDGEEVGKRTDEAAYTTEYLVRAVVTKKLVFRARPKPIVSNLPKTV